MKNSLYKIIRILTERTFVLSTFPKIYTHMQTYRIVIYTVTHTLIYIETETDKLEAYNYNSDDLDKDIPVCYVHR